MIIKFNKSDIWNLNFTLSKVILKALKEFKKSKRVGYPCDFKNQKQWDKVLDKMIYCFENLSKWDSGEEKFIIKRGKNAWKETKTGEIVKFDKIKANTRYSIVVLRKEVLDKRGLNKHRKLVKEGFELFSKYYNNLWD